ncbi:ABC transporter substrate-binding protein [Roseisalinus antarcticus]|uniref:Putative ABC transporter-binding protein n=1 Tax=Roseisalinus antarcticus TaxID=254357 RepID=A0A1Y5TKR8_9RHOB|nr:sugar ABC transporter substrate-binding protein [Roseisalinus antarcticus]SLN62673.1 putative ABC transporter-binding protein precursor [Roseisalinus antarcticus]
MRYLTTASAALIAAATGLAAQELPGSFEGVTIDAKLIGGQQYEALYNRIAEWEEATGATVNVISKKNHFELDREIKSDIATGQLNWCVGSNHSSFAPQYPGIYVDLRQYLPEEALSDFVPGNLASATLNDRLVMLPRAQFDVSALYYQKDLYEDPEQAAAFEAEYGYPLTVPETWDQVSDQAMFFADAPNFYGTQYAGKEEAIAGRFYEILIANGGEFLNDAGEPAFNSEAGVEALNWFVDLYAADAVPVGVPNYLWDDLGQGFASGTVALNLDWPGWAGFFNDPEASKVAGNVGVAPPPTGSAGIRSGWSGFHGFSVTEDCANPEAAASLVWFLTNEESQMLESAAGPLPSRQSVWAHVIEEAADDPYRSEVLAAFQTAAETAFPVPQTPSWIEITNVLYPELQAAILGDKTPQEALDEAADEATMILEDAGEL